MNSIQYRYKHVIDSLVSQKNKAEKEAMKYWVWGAMLKSEMGLPVLALLNVKRHTMYRCR